MLLGLPDIAKQSVGVQQQPRLDWVGMSKIHLPIQCYGQTWSASLDAGVSLDQADVRGIHMSRIYRESASLSNAPLSPALINQVLDAYLRSQQGLSACAQLSLDFAVLLQRPALISALSGWQHYPLQLTARLQQGDVTADIEYGLTLTYSSTCPCSAALARQLIQQQFMRDFSGSQVGREQVLAWLGSTDGIVATPHSQRSTANIRWRTSAADAIDQIPHLIDQLEQALGTPVQTAVKREDEQAFAWANGQNLMFCEDAARRLYQVMLQQAFKSFWIRVVHAESLHAHDAVAEVSWSR
ncbi:MAG: GTP cyclohydrolase FolE2 [Pseudomonadota bacterium]|nr:GTP cyclohydrolase FolE2 [Pseudomonadota bacterium]